MVFLKKPLKWTALGQEPSELKKSEGFKMDESPAPGHFDFMFRSTYEAVEELQQKAAEKEMVAINLDKKADVTYVNDMLSNVSADTSSLQINFIDLAIEVETTKNAELNGVTANIAIETFLNLDDVTLERGRYDAVNKWIEV